MLAVFGEAYEAIIHEQGKCWQIIPHANIRPDLFRHTARGLILLCISSVDIQQLFTPVASGDGLT
jgi:hypothetical protein